MSFELSGAFFRDSSLHNNRYGINLYSRSTPLAFIASGKFWVNNHAHIIKPIYGNVRFYVNLLETIDYTIYISGSAQPKLTQEKLVNIDIPVPEVEEQNRISNYIDNENAKIDKTIEKIQNEIQLLQEYRTALISEVVTGKIDVREEVASWT